jgi:hypothetical protein
MTYEGGKGNSAPAPDYTPMANASAEGARLGKELGDSQLAEAKRQYDETMKVSEPVVKAQLDTMEQTKQQGDDYYKYQTDTYRPLEQGMVAKAGVEGSDARLEEMASQATADIRGGQAAQANMMARQGLRYGYSPAKMAMMSAQQGGANAAAIAGGATQARTAQRNLGWARQMDAAGLGRNLAANSMGAYSLSNSSGSSAVGNQMAPGNALMTGMAQGAGMQQQGKGQQIQGLGSVLNSQTSVYNNSGGTDNTGAAIGAVGGIAVAMI